MSEESHFTYSDGGKLDWLNIVFLVVLLFMEKKTTIFKPGIPVVSYTSHCCCYFVLVRNLHQHPNLSFVVDKEALKTGQSSYYRSYLLLTSLKNMAACPVHL